MEISRLVCCFFLFIGSVIGEESIEEEEYGVKYASSCEVCKYVVVELENRLKETGKTHDVIEIGYGLDDKAKKKIKYTNTELRLLESLEGICDRLLDYNIHKERKDSTRFAKGMSTTFKVLHDLVDKGVKVDLGIPYDLWDKPSAEVTNLKTQCENLIEMHEETIEDWYYNHQEIPLRQFLCIDRALRKGDDGCLDEDLKLEKKEKKKKSKESRKKSESKSKDSSESREPEKSKAKDKDVKGDKDEL
ncbi:protein canopy homolog 3-like [Centruroides sculpturatus]|uniref:protein canopy homolog 3-like n=1 Tax=Centruroides sculpturatus TaxID=218467 RepID=UPI000C6EA413|nr:protein canopy homolog 3-like [Centruroides sculpturatus]